MIEFVKLYSKIEEAGYYTNALIAFQQIPFEFKAEDMGNGMARTVVSKYHCNLRINLWLIILNFKWNSLPNRRLLE